eukprot:Nk52_evm24s2118 gene=Nk52_evmTU24s2118
MSPVVASSMGTYPLHEAVGENDLERIVWLVMDCGLDIAERNMNGSLPVHKAVAMNRVDALRLLLKLGCPTNVRNAFGSVYHLAVSLNHGDCLRVLLRHTRDLGLLLDRDSLGRSLVEIALCQGSGDCMRVLLHHGVPVMDDVWFTQLEITRRCDRKTLECAKMLIDNTGMDLNRPYGVYPSVAHYFFVTMQYELVKHALRRELEKKSSTQEDDRVGPTREEGKIRSVVNDGSGIRSGENVQTSTSVCDQELCCCGTLSASSLSLDSESLQLYKDGNGELIPAVSSPNESLADSCSCATCPVLQDVPYGEEWAKLVNGNVDSDGFDSSWAVEKERYCCLERQRDWTRLQNDKNGHSDGASLDDASAVVGDGRGGAAERANRIATIERSRRLLVNNQLHNPESIENFETNSLLKLPHNAIQTAVRSRDRDLVSLLIRANYPVSLKRDKMGVPPAIANNSCVVGLNSSPAANERANSIPAQREHSRQNRPRRLSSFQLSRDGVRFMQAARGSNASWSSEGSSDDYAIGPLRRTRRISTLYTAGLEEDEDRDIGNGMDIERSESFSLLSRADYQHRSSFIHGGHPCTSTLSAKDSPYYCGHDGWFYIKDPCSLAIQNDDWEMLHILFSEGRCDVNQLSNHKTGDRLLHTAIRMCAANSAIYLYLCGANLGLKNELGETVLKMKGALTGDATVALLKTAMTLDILKSYNSSLFSMCRQNVFNELSDLNYEDFRKYIEKSYLPKDVKDRLMFKQEKLCMKNVVSEDSPFQIQ